MTIDDVRLAEAARRAVKAWGTEPQWRMLQEECAELIAAVNRLWRGRTGLQDIAEEVADVIIMTQQARAMLGAIVDEAVARKLTRLEGRLAAQEASR